MVSITLEGLWMVSDRIVNFWFFVKFHRSGPAIIFSFRTITEHDSYASKKLLIKPRFIRTSSRWSVLLRKDYGCFPIECSIFNFSSNFTGPAGPAIIFSFWTITEHVSYASKKAPNQAKIYQDLIKMVSITLEGLWMFSDRRFNFQFFVKFHRSGPATIFSFLTITEHVSYASKKLLIKPRFIRTSSTWSVLLWKDYGCFLIECSIFNFSSNFIGPDLQKFSVFELSQSMLVMHQKSS